MPSRNVNARPISWRISNDKRVNDLRDPWAMLTYTWLIPSADNLGRIEGDPDLLASMIFPRQRDEVTPERMAEILEMLHDAGLVFWYEVDGELFLQFPPDSWGKHQKLVGNMKAESDFPEPPTDLYEQWLKQTRVRTGMNQYKRVLNEGKGREGKEKGSCSTARTRAKDDDHDNQGQDDDRLSGSPNPQPVHTPALNAFFEQHFSTNTWHMDQLRLFVERGMDEDCVIYALELALEAGATQGIKYPKTILQSWRQASIKTRWQAEEHERKRKQLRGYDPPAEPEEDLTVDEIQRRRRERLGITDDELDQDEYSVNHDMVRKLTSMIGGPEHGAS